MTAIMRKVAGRAEAITLTDYPIAASQAHR
jgi:hypothetical protein